MRLVDLLPGQTHRVYRIQFVLEDHPPQTLHYWYPVCVCVSMSKVFKTFHELFMTHTQSHTHSPPTSTEVENTTNS